MHYALVFMLSKLISTWSRMKLCKLSFVCKQKYVVTFLVTMSSSLYSTVDKFCCVYDNEYYWKCWCLKFKKWRHCSVIISFIFYMVKSHVYFSCYGNSFLKFLCELLCMKTNSSKIYWCFLNIVLNCRYSRKFFLTYFQQHMYM